MQFCARGSVFYPYTWWVGLVPSEKYGGESFDKVVNQNFPSIFHWTNYTLDKQPPIFSFSP